MTLPNEEKERKLNPCPFCGGDAIEDRDCAGFYNYRCGKCKCSLYGDYEHHMTGRAAWNRRATPQPAPAQGVSDAEDAARLVWLLEQIPCGIADDLQCGISEIREAIDRARSAQTNGGGNG